MNRHFYAFCALLVTILAVVPHTSIAQGTLLGRCEGCEAVFEYGDGELAPADTLPDFGTTDRQLLLRGTIYESDGETPAEGVILYVYHTNAEGEYATRGDETGWARRHGYIRGWVKTAADGRYAFYTGMPGSYSSTPAHVHPIVLEPDGRYYWLTSWFFEGDPNLESGHDDARGGSGIVDPHEEDGMLVADRDIILGRNVPGYE